MKILRYYLYNITYIVLAYVGNKLKLHRFLRERIYDESDIVLKKVIICIYRRALFSYNNIKKSGKRRGRIHAAAEGVADI